MSQYFEENPDISNQKKEITITFKDKYYNLLTNNNMFSKDKLDYGTKVLLENFTEQEIEGKVLDLGCGYGIIGIVLATTYSSIKVDMCDITSRAIEILPP